MITKTHMKIAAGVGVGAFLVWWFTRKPSSPKPMLVNPTGDVMVGVPTVTGPNTTGTDYSITAQVDAVS